MKLSRRISGFLLAVGVWNVLTFLDFARRLVDDPGRPTGFYVAHTVLIVVNIAIGIALLTLGYRGWRATAADRRSAGGAAGVDEGAEARHGQHS